MALLNKSGIVNGQSIDASHITNIHDTLNGTGSFEVIASGSFTGSFTGTFNGLATSASYAVSASHEITTEIFSSTASLVDRADQPFITTFTSPITASSTVNIGPTTIATGLSSLAQGSGSDALGDYSHAQGRGTKAEGFASHAEGLTSTAEGSYSHAEGRLTLASGSYSHTQGHLTTASGDYSHAGGHGTIAAGNYQLVAGKFNIATTQATDGGSFIIGNGADANNRSNILFAGNNKIELNAPVTASADISSSATLTVNRITAPGYISTPLISNSSTVEINNNLSGSATTTASFGHYIGDGSQLTNVSVVSASYALTASHALNSSGGGGIFSDVNGHQQTINNLIISSSNPTSSLSVIGSGSTIIDILGSVGTLFSVDDDLSGTLFTANDVSGLPVLKADASGEVYLGKSPQSLYTTAVVSSTVANVSHSLCTLSTSSYDGAFFEYTAVSQSNARAGNIMSVWNDTLVFTETTTTDIGDTSDLTTKVIISGSTARLVAYGPNASYKVKTIIKAI